MDSYVPPGLVSQHAVPATHRSGQSSATAIVRIDANGYLKQVNAAGVRLLGCTSEDEAIASYFARFIKVLHVASNTSESASYRRTERRARGTGLAEPRLFGLIRTADGRKMPFEGAMLDSNWRQHAGEVVLELHPGENEEAD